MLGGDLVLMSKKKSKQKVRANKLSFTILVWSGLAPLMIFFVTLAISHHFMRAFSPLNKEAQEFLYLAKILGAVTDGKKTQKEQLKALTEWLAENVKKVDKYPDSFDGSSSARVIKAGIGNCGLQANNILTFAQLLGIKKLKRYSISRRTGGNLEHTFAEILVDGRWGIFDPNSLIYVETPSGTIASLQLMLADPELAGNNKYFQRVIEEIRINGKALRQTNILTAPMPFGENSYNFYRQYGSLSSELLLQLLNSPLLSLCIFLSIYLFFNLGVALLRASHRKRIARISDSDSQTRHHR